MIKIKIEHGDVGVAAAVAAIIENALANHGFDNVKGKTVMVHQRPRSEGYFKLVSQLTPVAHPQTVLDPVGYSSELLEARIAFGYPVMVDWMREDRPDVFHGPVYIDTGIEAAPFQEELLKFAKGE